MEPVQNCFFFAQRITQSLGVFLSLGTIWGIKSQIHPNPTKGGPTRMQSIIHFDEEAPKPRSLDAAYRIAGMEKEKLHKRRRKLI